jgi:hypothetical protein
MLLRDNAIGKDGCRHMIAFHQEFSLFREIFGEMTH